MYISVLEFAKNIILCALCKATSLPPPMGYETKGGDESDDEEAVPVAATKGGTGHHADAG